MLSGGHDMKKKRNPRAKFNFTVIDELMASPTETLPESWRRSQLLAMYEGLSQLETGETPGANDRRAVSDALNLFETLVNMGEVQDSQGLLKDALAIAGARHMDGKSLRLSGPGIQAVRALLEDYAEVIGVLSARIMVRAHRLTERRMTEILQGKRQAHDVTVMAL